MAKFDFNSDNLACRDVQAMRSMVDSHVFYLVVETVNTSSSGYDPIYGEAFDAFTSASQVSSTNYLPFEASILRRSRDDEMFRQGFHAQEKLVVDAAGVVDWQAGMLILFQGKRYRLSGVDARGLDYVDRFILYMDEVT